MDTLYDAHPLLQDLVDRAVLAYADRPAVVFGDDSLTYRQLNDRADALARAILHHAPEADYIGISTRRSIGMVVGVLAIVKAGKAYLPIDPEHPDQRVRQIIAGSGLTTIVAPAVDTATFAPMGLHVLDADAVYTFDPLPVVRQNSTVCVLYTSGSTGQPKGVCQQHTGLIRLMAWQQRHGVVGVGVNTLQFCHLTFDVSAQEIFLPLTTGGTIHLIDNADRLDAGRLLAFIRDRQINRAYLPYVALQYVCEAAVAENSFPAHFVEITMGGEQLKLTPAIRAFFEALPQTTMMNVYGPAEASIWVTEYRMRGNASTWPTIPPMGMPIVDAELFIVDENLQLLPDGEPGEILIAGECLAAGYLNQPTLTAERFIDWTHPQRGPIRVYRTGDMARYRPDGNLEFAGRRDEMVKIRGNRVELGEIEAALRQIGGLRESAVMVRTGANDQKQIVAYLVSEAGQADEARVRDELARRVTDYMMPATFIWMDRLPRTISDKVDKKLLPAPEAKRPDSAGPYQSPKTPLERSICDLWSRLLGLDRVGATDNFFALGGNSLLAQQTVAALKQQQLTLPITKLYQFPTATAIASLLSGSTIPTPKSPSAHSSPSFISSPEKQIAIIGMSGRFPGANTVEELWEVLKQGRETVRFFADDELDPAIPTATKTDSLYVKARGIVAGADLLDPAFFGLTPNQARLMDPQQRVFLEIAWDVLEQTGHVPSQFTGSVGVFAGTGTNTYYLRNVLSNPDLVANTTGEFEAELLNEKDYIATRTAYALNLTGPAVSVHSACSTSLLAIAQAVQSLRNGHCAVAVAGGVSITAPQNSGHLYQDGAMLSRDGHTRTFNADSTGTVFSDGAGVVLLKPLEAAQRDGDTIFAIIRGAGVSNDGGGKGSFMAPNATGQAEAIRMAHTDAAIDPATISYVEAHGTATPLGDPIEIDGLTMAFGEQDRTQFCAIGSIKSNLGHLTAASGVAGLIKTALALHHRWLPASINFDTPNPVIDFAHSPFFVQTTGTDWPANEPANPRRAGVSSFGVGGTNVHVVLEEWLDTDVPNHVPDTEKPAQTRPVQLVTWSAKTSSSRDAWAVRLAEQLRQPSGQTADLADIAFTSQTSRAEFGQRGFAVAATINDLIDQLQKPAKPAPTDASGEVVFMFPGQGAQYVNMGRALYEHEAVFREAVDQCADLVKPYLDLDIQQVLYPDTADEAAEARLNDTRYAQPALFVTEYALARLWMTWGINPSVLCGHSLGEFVAAHLAGVFSLADALRLVALRGRSMSDLPRGSMLSVRATVDVVQPLLPDTVSIAAVNSRQLCVASGPDEAITELAAQLDSQSIPNRRLATSHAFHSAMMDAVIAPFAELIGGITLNRPRLPIASTLTGTWLTDAQATDPNYWARHLRETVRFADALDTLLSLDTPILLDLGPGQASATFARQQADKKPITSLTSLTNQTDWPTICRALVTTLGQCWQQGLPVDWRAFYAGQARQRVKLPGYAFDRSRHWVNPPVAAPTTVASNYQSPAEPATIPDQPSQLPNSLVPMRKQLLLTKINERLEAASGLSMGDAGPDDNFLALGLDSLLLTQVALSLKKEFGLPITFRQLMSDYATPGQLADYLDSQLPADRYQPAPTAPVAAPAPVQQPAASVMPSPVAAFAPQPLPTGYEIQALPGNDSALGLIAQQLQILAKQVALLQQPVPATPLMPVPAPVQQQPAVPMPIPVLSVNGQHGHASQSPITNPQSSITNNQSQITPEEAAELKKPFGATARIERKATGLTDRQQQFLSDLTDRYTRKTAASKAYAQQHRPQMADPRVVSGFRPLTKEIVYPLVVNRSAGSRLWDIDGNEYIDVLNGFGSNLYGYQPEFVKQALHQQIDTGFEVGPQHELAGEVCALIAEMTGSERVALCSTGSEAVLGAMRVARTVTGRSLIVAFTGSYHGIMDEVIVRGTKAGKSFPAAPGIMPEAVQNMLILDYGTDETLRIIRDRAGELAAVLVEPVQSRRPEFVPIDFLKQLRVITTASETALIFDEVITGFRAHPGGLQAMFGIRADLVTYGKVVGAGIPIGVIAGKRDFMDALDGGFWQYQDESVPEIGVTYFAGTFVRHPLALAAAKAALTHLKAVGPAMQEGLNQKTTRLANALNTLLQRHGLPMFIAHFSSLWKLKTTQDIPYAELLFTLLREKGIHIWDGFPCFMTEAHTDAEIDTIIIRFEESLTAMVTAGFFVGTEPVPAPVVQPAPALPTNMPPVPGARLGRDPQGNPGWFVADPMLPGKYLQVN